MKKRINGIQKGKLVFFICLLVLAPLCSGDIISVNPATDEEEIVFIPAVKERNMGRQINEQVVKQYDLTVDPLIQKRVGEIGEKIAAGSDRKDIVYRFRVLNDKKEDNYNAFAAPGGYIYIFDDLVKILETDDKIAAVLAHEMGHVEARHSVKRMQGSLGATALMLLGAHMQTEKGAHNTANMAIGQLLSAYSRQDERQADELCVKYLKYAGFNPVGSIKALEKLRDLRKDAPRRKYSYYHSHPYLSERIAYLRKYIKGYTDFDSYINLVSETE